MSDRNPQAFFWRVKEDSDRWETIDACDAETAAEIAAERYDAGDYGLTRGIEARVEIRDMRTGAITEWIASAEMVAHYSVSPVEEGE